MGPLNQTFSSPEPAAIRDSGAVVTAVMITGMHVARYPLAKVAIECFINQTYKNKQLLIINHGEQSLACGDPRIHEVRVTKKESETVGDLRNLAFQFATGDFLITWDDDDWYHSRRIELQMSAQKEDAAVLLMNRIHYSFENGCSRYASATTGWEATVLHPRDVPFRYPSLLRGSDSMFVNQFKQRIVVDDDPAMYIRFYHGLNLWDAKHIMKDLANPDLKNELKIKAKHQRLLECVLALYKNAGYDHGFGRKTHNKSTTGPVAH